MVDLISLLHSPTGENQDLNNMNGNGIRYLNGKNHLSYGWELGTVIKKELVFNLGYCFDNLSQNFR